MKKVLSIITTALLVLTACSKEDFKESDLIGQWKPVSLKIWDGDEIMDMSFPEDSENTESWTFMEDGVLYINYPNSHTRLLYKLVGNNLIIRDTGMPSSVCTVKKLTSSTLKLYIESDEEQPPYYPWYPGKSSYTFKKQ